MIIASVTSPADVLLRYLWVRRTGSALQFREAARFCFGKDVRHLALARRFCALGHVEFDWNGPELKWRVVPPSFYRANGRLNLCGLLLDEDIRIIQGRGFQLDSYKEEFLATCLIDRYFIADENGAAGLYLAEPPQSFPVAKEAYKDLLQRLAPLRDLLVRQPFEEPPATVLQFNIATRRFDEEIESPRPDDGLLKALDVGKPRYFFENRLVDLTTGLWLALCEDASIRAEYDNAGLVVPSFPDLPPLFERLFYFSGARRETLSGGRVRFHPVESDVARMIVTRLGIKHVEGLERE